jgi:hypothetical protein
MVPRGYWLNVVGGLIYGDKGYGDTELTKEQYDELFAFAPEHRAQALPLLTLQSELEEVSKANTAAVIAEVSAHDVADKAASEAQAVFNEHQAALKENPDTPVPAIEEALKAAQEARAAAEAASAVTAPLQEKLATLREQLQAMPPRQVVAA